MISRRTMVGWSGVVGVALATFAWSEEPSGKASPSSPGQPPASAPSVTESGKPDRVEAARHQAKLMHNIYATTLDVIHERYFRNDRSAIPARAMEEVFTEIQRQSKIQTRWIGVNAKTMSIDHEPKDQFEKNAAQAIGAGKEDFEAIEGGFYRRAEGIPLTAGCLTCHGTFGVTPKTPRFAGLVISIPLKTDAAPPQTP